MLKVKDVCEMPEKDDLPLELQHCSMEIHRKEQNITPLFNSIRNGIIEEISNLPVDLKDKLDKHKLAQSIKTNTKLCEKCNGDGTTFCGFSEGKQVRMECSNCNRIRMECSNCNGKGIVINTQAIINNINDCLKGDT